MNNSKVILALGVLAIIAGAWLFRFEMVPGSARAGRLAARPMVGGNMLRRS